MFFLQRRGKAQYAETPGTSETGGTLGSETGKSAKDVEQKQVIKDTLPALPRIFSWESWSDPSLVHRVFHLPAGWAQAFPLGWVGFWEKPEIEAWRDAWGLEWEATECLFHAFIWAKQGTWPAQIQGDRERFYLLMDRAAKSCEHQWGMDKREKVYHKMQ